MRRRDFIAGLGATCGTWPRAAHAQQSGRMRRIGVLVGYAEDDPEIRARLAGLRQGLERLGWSEGRNVRIDYRFLSAGIGPVAATARELIALQPDVLLTVSTGFTTALHRETRTIPIVFVGVGDPIGVGLIASLARPGGNVTGLMSIEASIVGKWLAMLKEMVPDLKRAAILGNPKTTALDYYLKTANALAPSLGIEIAPARIEIAADIERSIESLAREPNGGLVLPPDVTTGSHRGLVIAQAARHHLPAIYGMRIFVADGGLMSYGVDYVDHFRQAATYIDRILRGADPADLPVQAPIKFETIINLKTAKILGLTVPPGLLVAADEVIE